MFDETKVVRKEKKKTDTQLAAEQGVSRQAINRRRNVYGWTEKEIIAGFREGEDRIVYNTSLVAMLGITVAQYAELCYVSPSEIYRRNRAGRLKDVDKEQIIEAALERGIIGTEEEKTEARAKWAKKEEARKLAEMEGEG